MYSKTYTSNLVLPVNNFTNKYKNISKLYINDNIFTDSYLYGMKRQHNFLSSNALLNNQSTFLDIRSANKLVNFNFKNELDSNTSVTNNDNFNFFKKITNVKNSLSNLNFLSIVEKFETSFEKNNYKNIITYPNLISSLNDNSDKKKITQPIYKLLNSSVTNSNFNNINNLSTLNSFNDNAILLNNNETASFFNNNSTSYKILSTSSSNQSLSPQERFIRKNINLSPLSSHFNYSLNVNNLNEYTNQSLNSNGLNNFKLFNYSNAE